MNRLKFLLLAGSGLAFATSSFGQHAFSSCSAAFLNNKMVVDTYTTAGKCKLTTTATGQLTLQTVDLSPKGSKGIRKLPFSVAIRDKNTKTLLLFTKEAVSAISIQRVLANCRKGDAIVLLTPDSRYALPHNEILVH